MEPARGILTGVNLDHAAHTPLSFNTTTRVDHVLFVVFTGWPPDYNALDERVAQIARVQGALVVTPMPWGNPDGITGAHIDAFAARLHTYITQYDVPVFVRFAHEMNGSWYPYGGQPVRYTNAFRRMAHAVRPLGPRAAMVWGVANYQGYPFDYNNKNLAGYLASAYHGTSNDFAAMDTNGDGLLTSADDPYGPYYPGDDVVDWVGSSVYHTHNTWPPDANNSVPYDRKVTQLLTGFSGLTESLNNFYVRFAQSRGKPMMLPETSAAYVAGRGGPSDADVKQGWVNQLYHIGATTPAAESLPIRYPLIKAIGWFDILKQEDIGRGLEWVDWRISANSIARTNYTAFLHQTYQDARYCLNAGDAAGFVYGWNGWLNGWQSGSAPAALSIATNARHGGGALQVAYGGSTSGQVRAAVKTDARYDTGWSQADTISLWARLPLTSPDVALGLAFEHSGSNWYHLGECPLHADGQWHRLMWPYAPHIVTAASELAVHITITPASNLPWVISLDSLSAFQASSNAAPPATLTASRGTYADRVRLGWTASPGADAYHVARSTAPSSAMAVVVSPVLPGLSFDDTSVTPGLTYYYWVRASNTFGWGAFGASADGYAGSFTAGLLNGSFEQEGATGGKPADWRWDTAGAGNIWLSTNYARSGVRAVMFPGWNEWNTLVQTYAHAWLADGVVTAAVWGLTPGFSNANAGGTLLLRDTAAPSVLYGSTQFVTRTTPPQQWVQAVIVTTLPAHVDSIDVVLQLQGNADGLVYFDDATLDVPVPEPPWLGACGGWLLWAWCRLAAQRTDARLTAARGMNSEIPT